MMHGPMMTILCQCGQEHEFLLQIMPAGTVIHDAVSGEDQTLLNGQGIIRRDTLFVTQKTYDELNAKYPGSHPLE